MFITLNNTVLSVDDNTVLPVSLSHQQDATLTRTVNLKRFSDESTRLKSLITKVSFGMWQARTGKREEALTCAAGYRPHHQSSSGGHHDTQNSIQWVSIRSSP
nr:MAG TPA: hypothetical protein [Caudoviricetes sp.]